jgi:GNAT superfamily N-acetyltransferase
MVTPASPDRHLLAIALTRVPDLPRWVDTRGMLLSGRGAVVSAIPHAADSGFVVLMRDAALASIVGRPPGDVVLAALATLAGDVNVLAQLEDAEFAGQLLAGWQRRAAIIHVPGAASETPVADPRGEPTHVFTRSTAPRFDHLDDGLRQELVQALEGRTVARFVPGELPPATVTSSGSSIPIAAAWADGRPVAFCYPVWQTERYWDVSVETWAPYQRRGLGERAARAMIAHMRRTGREPVWGALESNTASRRLAARLGFIEAAGLAVWTKR